MSNRRAVRRLVVPDATWLWSVRHACRPCSETVSLHRDGAETLRIVFSEGPGRFVPEYMGHTGSVGDGESTLNLNEPGVVRRLLDEATARGARETGRRETVLDGWLLFDAVVRADPRVGDRRE
ncbi:hypothetical protein ACIGEZ_19095 [Streptomyces sp. NPDC085481]|uniref:hypothetical protein n=1 Tax=Streptomyces sp. NPDC085481 TaxID=3365727 RepID=UPI0037D1FA5E